MSIILTKEQIDEDKERRVKAFQKEYQELSKKYQIDIGADIQPVIKFVDAKEYPKE